MAKKQPNWRFTPKRRASLKKAQKVATKMRKKANVAVITRSNRARVKRQNPNN